MFRKSRAKPDAEQDELLSALAETRSALEGARLSFENASEPELVDATVFEINSLQARYNYLLRRVRETGCRVEASFRPARIGKQRA